MILIIYFTLHLLLISINLLIIPFLYFSLLNIKYIFHIIFFNEIIINLEYIKQKILLNIHFFYYF